MDEDFDVRGAHEEAAEERAARRAPLAQGIALFSAMLATLGAILSLLAGHTQSEALYHKDEAVLLKARASDQWTYYQAEEIKRHLYEVNGAGDRAATYAARGETLKADAERLDRASLAADAEAEHALAPHGKLSIAVTLVQIAIALASITALTGRRWLFAMAATAAAAGMMLAIGAWA